MNFIGGQHIFFIGDSSIEDTPPPFAPILTFDVFYRDPPIAGFHVVKEPEDE